MRILSSAIVASAVSLLSACSSGDPSSTGGANALCPAAPVTIEHTDGAAGTPTVHVLSTSTYPLAVCNDGTPASFVLRPGFGAGRKRWIVYLEGGGHCETASDCATRYATTPGYMTSSSAVDGQTYAGTLGGIKSTDPAINPDFHDATLVQIAYCSSDLWSGDVEGNDSLPTSELGRWHFRGKRIVEAVMAELAHHGLGDATEVLLAGSSAGGQGVLFRADDVRASLPSRARFLALVDAGFFIDYPTYDPSTGLESTAVPTGPEVDLANGITAWGGSGDADCEAGASDLYARMLCRSAFDLLYSGWVTTPLFVRQSEYDNVQMKSLIPATYKDANAMAFRSRFAAKLVADLDLLTEQAIFASNARSHGVINDDVEFTSTVASGVALPEALGAWYRTPCANGHRAAGNVYVDAP